MVRFNNEALKVEGYSDDIALTAMMAGLKDEKFLWSLGKKTPIKYTELLSRAQKYMSAGELLSARSAPEEGVVANTQNIKEKIEQKMLPGGMIAIEMIRGGRSKTDLVNRVFLLASSRNTPLPPYQQSSYSWKSKIRTWLGGRRG